MTTKHDYMAALRNAELSLMVKKKSLEYERNGAAFWRSPDEQVQAIKIVESDVRNYEAIIHALKVAHAVMQEPSDAMLEAAQDAWIKDPLKRSSTIFKAMRDKMLEGVE